MDLGLNGKVVLVTGGSSGIGLETARAFAREGAQVAISSRSPDKLDTAAKDVRATTGADVATIPADVTRLEDIEALCSTVLDRFGHLDVLVNNAGTGTYKPFLEVTDDELMYGMAINFFAQFRITQRLVPAMIDHGGGVVINVAGETGIQVTPPPFRSSCTGPAKSAEIRLSKILATELGPYNIRVNCVVPGYVLTEERFAKWEREISDGDLTEEEAAETRRHWGRGIARPDNEWGRPEEIADLMVFAASSRASFVNGAVLVADGGDDKS